MKKNFLNKILSISFIALMSAGLASCEDGKSYSDMLDDERDAVNWYLAHQKVVANVPEDSIFETGPDAPFYRMTAEGTVYMRVINKGDENNRPEKGQTVYFRSVSFDMLSMYSDKTLNPTGSGNATSVISGTTSFVFGNTVLSSTTQLGTGVQVPMKYLGYNSEVDLIVKSVDGPSDLIANCIPILYKNLKYFKAEY